MHIERKLLEHTFVVGACSALCPRQNIFPNSECVCVCVCQSSRVKKQALRTVGRCMAKNVFRSFAINVYDVNGDK